MRVVSNTSPISNLAIIGRLELLQRRYQIVRIPPAVRRELEALSHPTAKRAVDDALATGWIRTEELLHPVSTLAAQLDPGETEAIALALQNQADVLLMD